MTKQKKLQRDFIMKITFLKNFWRARISVRIAVKSQKSSIFGIGGRIFWARARGSARANFFGIEKFIKFSTSYIFLIFSYRLNSWF